MLHEAFIRCFMIGIYQMFKLGLLCLTVDAFFFIQSLKIGLSFHLPSVVKTPFNHRTYFWRRAACFGNSGFAVLLVWLVSSLRLSCCVKHFPRVFRRLFLKAGQRGPHGERESRKTCLTNTTNNRWRRLSSASNPARRRRKGKLWVRCVRWVYFTGFSATYNDEFMVLSKDMHSFVKHR